MKQESLWDEFVRIAEKSETDKSIDTLSSTRRMSHISKEDMEKLYSTKPKSQTYKNNISESAHEGNIVVMDAYDKLNGLVETITERQNIMLRIVNKHNTGHLDTPKYAKELGLSLVKTSNALSKTHPHLAVLAEACISDISAEMKKVAGAGNIDLPTVASGGGMLARTMAMAGTAGWIGLGVGAAIAVLYAEQHLRNIDRGFEENHKSLMSEVEDLSKSTKGYLVGNQWSSNLMEDMSNFKEMLIKFHDLYQGTISVINSVEKPQSAHQLVDQIKKQNGKDTSVQKAYQKLFAAVDSMVAFIKRVRTNFKNEDYKKRNIQEKALVTEWIDKTEVLHGGNGLIADDFDDVVHAIDPYLMSLAKMLEIFTKSKSVGERAKADIEAANVEKSNVGISQHDELNKKEEVTPASVPAKETPVAPEPQRTTGRMLRDIESKTPKLPPQEEANVSPRESRISRI